MRRGSWKSRCSFLRELLSDMLTVSLLLVILGSLWMAYTELQTGELQFFMGLKPVYIASGSMEPAIPTGAVVILQEAKGEDVKTGDIITFEQNGSYVTHRLLGTDEEAKKEGAEAYLITKGDHNRTEDMMRLDPENIRGKVVCVLSLPAGLRRFSE